MYWWRKPEYKEKKHTDLLYVKCKRSTKYFILQHNNSLTVKYSQYVTLPTCNTIQHIVKYSQYVTLPTCNTIQHIVKHSQYATLPTCNTIQHIVKYSQYVTLSTCNTIHYQFCFRLEKNIKKSHIQTIFVIR